MEKLKLHSPDLTQDNIARLAELFPNCVTESRAEDGTLKRAIDFDQLRQELSTAIVEGPQERYQLNWPGKREALLTANAPIAKTLRPCREESVDFDTTQNLFIEGDNLDALKLLQETYLNKVKMIYIDPPYNTGNDFIYEDDFAENTEAYFVRSNQKDEVGNRMVANPESNGRRHSDWLSMVYPRLKLARNLLCNDGVIFISIDDNELDNLRKVCDEIFGEDNFLAQLVWRSDGNFDNQAKIKICHEYILLYAKFADDFPHPPVVDPSTPTDSKLFKPEIRNTIVKNGSKNPISKVTLPKGLGADIESGQIVSRSMPWPRYLNDAIIENGKLVGEVVVESGWSSKDLLLEFIKNECRPIIDSKGQETLFVISKTGAIEVVKRRSDYQSHVISVLNGFGGTQKATAQLDEIGAFFNGYPKPVELIRYMVQMILDKDAIIVDFFAGSGPIAHAVMTQNAADAGHRKYILVQIPEQLEPLNENQKAAANYCDKLGIPRTVAELTKERIRRAGQKIKAENALTAPDLDIGFRVLKIDSSNMKDVYYAPDAVKQGDLLAQVDNIRADRTPEDLLFQVLIDWGVDLALPIRKETIYPQITQLNADLDNQENNLRESAQSADRKAKAFEVFFVDGNALAACFDTGIDEAFVKVLAARHPLRAVFRDAGFGSDSVKINIEQIFKLISPTTEVKAL